MSPRARLLLLGLVAAVAAFVVWRPAAAPSRAAHEPGARPGGGAPRAPLAAAGREPAPDPSRIRDVFRFAPRTEAPELGPPQPSVPAAPPEPAAAAGLRLIGLVRRQGALLAAFAIGGDVVLAGAGQSAGELTVLEVGEDGVRVRFADGREERLPIP